MDKLNKEDFLKVLKKDKPNYVEYKSKFYYRPFCGSYSEYTFYYSNCYYYSTRCYDCALLMEGIIKELKIDIIVMGDG